MSFCGSLVALITPFDAKGRVDRKTLEKLVEWHIQEGTDGIVCCATTGEGPCLTDAERKTVSEICIRTAMKRIPIIVSTSSPDTRLAVQYTEKAQSWGADGCLVVTPFYNKPSQKGCFLHFKEVAKVGLPLIVYHNPGRAVVRLTAETVAEIAQIPGVAAIKESSHDIELIRKIGKLCKIPILSGEDDLTFETIQEGGIGTISVIGNLIPRGWKKMVQLALDKKWDASRKLAQRYLPLCKALFVETNPQCIKYAMSWRNLCKPYYHLPMLLPTEANQQALKKTILSLALPQYSVSDPCPTKD